MAKSKVGALDSVLQYVKNKLPQTGFFSTLDELINSAPFEKAPLQEWKNYLQPGRTFEREGVRFPLKKEELDYTFGSPNFSASLIPSWKTVDPSKAFTRAELQEAIRGARPNFGLRVGTEGGGSSIAVRQNRFPAEFNLGPQAGMDRPENGEWRRPPIMEEDRYRDYAHPTFSSGYEETATRSNDFDQFNTHFGPDVISHSRTTLHALDPSIYGSVPDGDPRQGLMRLIEEIQSDRHQAAAKKIYADGADEGNAELYRDMLETKRTGSFIQGERRAATPDELETASLELAEIESRMKRRGYTTQDTPRERSDLSKQLEDLSETIRAQGQHLEGLRHASAPGQLAADRELDNLVDRRNLLEDRQKELKDLVPDAPFKDPADYAALEIKNQMLNAAKQNEDYLGLVSGRDISERFSHEDEAASGTAHVYNTIYPAVLKKLARQYGIEVGPVATNLGSNVDVAAPTMRAHDTENIEDFMQRMDDSIAAGHNGGEEDAHELPIEAMRELVKDFEDVNPLQEQKANGYINQIEKLYADKKSGDEPEELAQLWGYLTETFDKLHGEYAKAKKMGMLEGETSNKSFLSMKLTPEIRDKIKRIGVPIWALAGMGVGMHELGANEEPEGFAEGGMVERLGNLARKLGYSGNGAPEVRARVASGLMSQIAGLKEDGTAGFGPLVSADEKGNLRSSWAPGLIDELKASPMLLEILGIEAPQWARDAQDRSDKLHQLVRSQMHVAEPRGFAENMDESLGMMLGQLPVPGGSTKRVGSTLREAAQLGETSALAPLEYLLPTIKPSIENYLSGAVAGGELSSLPDQLAVLMAKQRGETPVVKKAEGGAVKTPAHVQPIRDMIDELRLRLDELGENNALDI